MRKKSLPGWLKWVALAVCLCLVVVGLILAVGPFTAPDPDEHSYGDGPPSITIDGVAYCVSPYPNEPDTLPEGFALTGETHVSGTGPYSYYTNPDMPEWVYVEQNGYVRFVDVRLRGKDLINYNGEYYISMWSAEAYGDHPDVAQEYWNKMERTYGVQIDGNLPKGFVSAGITEFSGYDTIPRGSLVSNTEDYEVFVNPSFPDVIFASSLWHTDGKDWKFDVYIRYDLPFA